MLIIGLGIGLVVGFVAGVLVGRRNKGKVEATLAEAERLRKKLDNIK